jgi:CubicO group peptidase (beta-lactamase class C family)
MLKISTAFWGSAWWWTLFAAIILPCSWPLQCSAHPDDDLEMRFRRQTEATLGTIVREGRSSFAGAMLVEEGRLVATSAYGVEDPVSVSPISMQSTLIDLYSLRKLFVAVAIAQLVDRRVIGSIDDPINLYLKHYKLPKAFGREVTIRALATHTAGLDQAEFGAGRLAYEPARFFELRFPGYVQNAGQLSAYDSYGPKLLGYMVSEITGRPFSRYVEESILGPLAMNDTHLRTTPEPLAHRIVAFQPKRPEVAQSGDPLKPVEAALVDGSSVSTFGDLAKFMVALVGPAPEQNVVTPHMRELMFRILQSNGDGGSAHGLLFDAIRLGATTLFVHGGVGPGTKSMMALDVDRRAGVFYCYGDVRRRFDHDPDLLPPPYERMTDLMLEPLVSCSTEHAGGCWPPPGSTWNDSWKRYLGVYVNTARHHGGFSHLRSLIHPTLAHVARAGQSLELDGVGGYVEISPGIFASPHHLATLSFLRDEIGGTTKMSVSDRPSVYDRADSLIDDPRVPALCLAVLALIALSGGIFGVLPAYRVDLRARIAAASYAGVVACGIVALFGFGAFGRRYFDGISWPLELVRVCAFLTIPASVSLLAGVPRLARAGYPASMRLARLHYGAIAVSSILMAALLFGVGVLAFTPIT